MRGILKSNYSNVFKEFTITALIMGVGALLVYDAPGQLIAATAHINNMAGTEVISEMQMGWNLGIVPVYFAILVALLTTTTRLLIDFGTFAYTAVKLKIADKKNKTATEGGESDARTAT